MRSCLILSVLALAGCGEHLGYNPNYNFAPTRYGEYRVNREVALMTDTESPRTIPLGRPYYAPTAAQIAGRSPVPPPPTMGVNQTRVVKPVARVPATQGPIQIAPPAMRTGNQPPL